MFQGNNNFNFNNGQFGGGGYPYNQLPNPNIPNEVNPFGRSSLFFDQDTFENTRQFQAGILITAEFYFLCTRNKWKNYC